jgi:acyl-CoA dehydrogenase
MHIDTDAVLRQVRALDSEGAALIDALLQRMPQFVHQADAAGDVPAAFWDTLPVEALNRLNLPLAHGGLPMTASAVRRAITFDIIGRICPALPMSLPGPGLSMPPVSALGTPDQQRDYFARFVGQQRPVWGAFAITEPQGGSDAANMRTRARLEDGNYVLDGEKCFITSGARADAVIVFATLDPAKGRFGVRAFMVPRGTPGFRVDRSEDMMGLRASQLSALSFEHCVLSPAHMLGHTGRRGPLIDAFTGAQSAWDYMRPALAAGINGTCAGILAYAEGCLDTGEAVLPRARLAAAYDEIDVLRARVQASQMLALRAAWIYDSGGRASLDASMAKAMASTLAMDVAQRLAAMLPLQAASRGNPLEKFFRDAKAFDILEGTGDMQRLMIARAFAPQREEGIIQ